MTINTPVSMGGSTKNDAPVRVGWALPTLYNSRKSTLLEPANQMLQNENKCSPQYIAPLQFIAHHVRTQLIAVGKAHPTIYVLFFFTLTAFSLITLEIQKISTNKIGAYLKNQESPLWTLSTQYPITGFLVRGNSVYLQTQSPANKQTWLMRVNRVSGKAIFSTAIPEYSLTDLYHNAIVLQDCVELSCSSRVLNNNNGKFILEYEGSLKYLSGQNAFFVVSGVRHLNYAKKPELIMLNTKTLESRHLSFWIISRNNCGTPELTLDDSKDTIILKNQIGFTRADECGEFVKWFSL